MLESSKVPALTRAIDILNLIARIGPCSAATIIDTLGIPKSTAYLLLNELRRLNRPGFPGECFICELRLPDHRFRWKH
uniref:helix-turn-helix domain-containing protein n=1 Tax=Escherichia coli TaxID=562 RepID=UPI00201CAF84